MTTTAEMSDQELIKELKKRGYAMMRKKEKEDLVTGTLRGAQEPPDDPRIFNRKQKDGTHRPISEFFEPGAGA